MSVESLREFMPWEVHHETIFVDWADKAACYKWMHNKSYLKYNNEKLKSTSVDTTTLAENLQNLLVTTEELFKI